MSEVIVPGFAHVPGVHCGSTAMADLARHQGHELSEAMCFGLGAGLAFFYLRDQPIPSRVFHGRGLTMEQDLCAGLGARFASVTEPDPEAAWRRVRDRLDEGRAVVLQCDVMYLPHYRSSLPFNGHRVVLAGYDPADDTALVADTQFPGLLRVPQEDLRRARASHGPPAMYSANLWWEIELPAALPDLPAVARRQMAQAGRRMLEAPSDLAGLPALARLAADLPGWSALPDAHVCAHFGYQVIERRGTGGALFRRLYGRFLAEAAARWPDLVPAAALAVVPAVCDAWTELAGRLKAEASRRPPALDAAAAIVTRLVDLERTLAEALAAA